MDSHGSEPPTSPALTGATSRPADDDVTRGRQAESAEHAPRIPEFRGVERRPDGTWTAIHKATGEPITATTFEQLERVEAPMVRLAHALWGSS
ncbi:hypothetical protein [Nonomuraea basaltis]|uniref:hypothetical protein n=1 Tax=Nonomuraea basaltis TaxID=2495887 RepID=UPI00110C6A9B|nr:hypothetical protein [Nonomuraea basaltis]TMR88121.1 hypothetical protein EJK15_67990 [Nonomuraea basaltis]